MGGFGRAALSAVVVMLGCAAEEEVWEGRVVQLQGVQRVENPRAPLAPLGAIDAESLWSATGPSEGDIWEAPNQLHVFGDDIYVVDRMASKVHRFSADGAPRGSVGSPGEGPGEYRRIIDAIPTRVGLFVVDGGNGRVDLLDLEGEVLASTPLDQVVFSALPLGGDAIAVSGMLGRERRWLRIDAEGRVEPLDFPEFSDSEALEETPSRATSFQGRPVRLRYTSPQIQFFSASGALARVIDLPLPAEEATDEEIEAVVREMASVMAADGMPSSVIEQQAERVRSRPRVKYRFREVRFDAARGWMGIWEQNPEDFGSGNASLHLLSPEGVFLGSVAFSRAWSAFDLEDGVVYALARDPATDLVTLEAMSIVMPEEVLERAGLLAADGAR